MKKQFSKISLILIFLFGISFLLVLSPIQEVLKSTPTVNPYSPSKYGIPTSLAGYKVVAVLAEDNTACLASGEKRLILQTTSTSIDDFLKASRSDNVKQELQKLGLEEMATIWTFQFVGPDISEEQFLLENEKGNQRAAIAGCQKIEHLP